MTTIINVKDKKVYFNYNSKGELIEVVIIEPTENYNIIESWLRD